MPDACLPDSLPFSHHQCSSFAAYRVRTFVCAYVGDAFLFARVTILYVGHAGGTLNMSTTTWSQTGHHTHPVDMW